MDAPTGLTITVSNDSRVDIRWSAVTGAAGYRVRIINETEIHEVADTVLGYSSYNFGYTLISGSTIQFGVKAFTSGEESTESVITATVMVKEVPEWHFVRVLEGTNDAVFSVKNSTNQSFKIKQFSNTAIEGPYNNLVLATYDFITPRELHLVKGIFSSAGFSKAALIAGIGAQNENWLTAKVFYKAQYSDDNSNWSDASTVAGTVGSPSSTSDATTTLVAEEEHRYWRVILTDATVLIGGVNTSVNNADYRLNIYELNLDLWIKTNNYTLTHARVYNQFANQGSQTLRSTLAYTGGELVIPSVVVNGYFGLKIALVNLGGASSLSTSMFTIPYNFVTASYNHKIAVFKWTYPNTSGNSLVGTKSFILTGLSVDPIITGDLEGVINESESGSAITFMDYTFSVANLSPETTYDVTVAPYLPGGISAMAATMTLVTPVLPPVPASPTNVVTSNYQDNALSISWDATQYADYYKISGVYGDQVVTTTTNSTVLLKVPFGIEFSIGVLAGNEAGESAETSVVAMTRPGNIKSVEIEAMDADFITLSMETENLWELDSKDYDIDVINYGYGIFHGAHTRPLSFSGGLKRRVKKVRIELLDLLARTHMATHPELYTLVRRDSAPTFAELVTIGATPVIQASNDDINFVTLSQSFNLESPSVAIFSLTNSDQYAYWRFSYTNPTSPVRRASRAYYKLDPPITNGEYDTSESVSSYTTINATYYDVLDSHHVTGLNIYDQLTSALLMSAPYDGGATAIVDRSQSLFSRSLMLELENEEGSGPRYQNVRFDTSAAPFDLRTTDIGIGSIQLQWSQLGTRNRFRIEGITGLDDILTLDPIGSGEAEGSSDIDFSIMKYLCHDEITKKDLFGYVPRTNEILRFSTFKESSIKARISPPTGAQYYYNNLADMRVDNSLNIYAVDSGRRRIVKMDSVGNAIATTDVNGSPIAQFKSMTSWDFGPNFIAIADSVAKKVHIFDYTLAYIKTVTLRAYIRPADTLAGLIGSVGSSVHGTVTHNSWFSFGDNSEGLENTNFVDLQPDTIQIYSGDILKLTFGVSYKLNPSIYGPAYSYWRYWYADNLIQIKKGQSIFLDLYGNNVDATGLTRPVVPFLKAGLPNAIDIPSDIDTSVYSSFRYSATGLSSGSLYTVKLRSIDDQGVGSLPSNEISVRTLSIAPQLRLAHSDDVTAYTVRLYYSDFNVSTQLYKFYIVGQTGSYLTKAKDNDQFIDFDSLEPNKEYKFTMTAVSAAGIETGMSNEVVFLTRPDKPANLRVGKIRSGTVKIKWNVTSPATFYKIYGLGANPIICGQNMFTARNLDDNTTYNITVAAFNVTGGSVISDSKSFKLADLPIVTMFIEQTSANDSSITLNWETIDDVNYYEIYTDDILYNDEIANPPSAVINLAPNTAYRVKVRGYDSFGGVFESFELYTKTYPQSFIDVTPDTEVLNPIEKTKAKLKWSSVNGAVKYKVTLNANTVEEVITKTEITNLVAGTKYTAQVEAVDALDVLLNTDAFNFITDLDTPIGLAVVTSSILSDRATLRFVYPGGTDGIDKLAFFNGATEIKEVDYAVGTYEVELDGLTPATSYSISFKSRNNHMDSPMSNAVVFTTKTV